MNRRNTIQRDIIINTLYSLNHPTAEEVYIEILKTYPEFSLATVYRNLRCLAQMGLIKKLTIGSSIDHYDVNTDKHYHLQCLKCNKVKDVLVDYQDFLDEKANFKKSIKVYEHQLIFTGLCEECNKD